MSEVTRLIERIQAGNPQGTDELFKLVYAELRALAEGKLAVERPDHTLTATALVHEAYLRLFDENETERWKSHGQFFSAAAEAMRRILIDSYRRKKSAKHGGNARLVSSSTFDVPWAEHHEQMLAINELLELFEEDYPRQTEVFKLRCFCGMTGHEVSEVLQISPRTESNDWAFAKAWLSRRLSELS